VSCQDTEERLPDGTYRPVRIINHIHSLKLPVALVGPDKNVRWEVRYIRGDQLGIRASPVCQAPKCQEVATHKEVAGGQQRLCCGEVRGIVIYLVVKL
jgi:hypothetical protein